MMLAATWATSAQKDERCSPGSHPPLAFNPVKLGHRVNFRWMAIKTPSAFGLTSVLSQYVQAAASGQVYIQNNTGIIVL